jgi:hypothetical protein
VRILFFNDFNQILFEQILLGIAAAGVLRLLLATRPYDACKGGATVLTTYVAQNATAANGGVSYAADYVRNWQVCIN